MNDDEIRQLAESMVVEHVQNQIDRLTQRIANALNAGDKLLSQTELRVWVGIQQELPALVTDDTVIPIPDPDRPVRELCDALSEPYETPSGHRMEPPYRMTWERALDIVRGRTAVWSALLRRAETVDADWLHQYRRAGSPHA